MSASRGNPTGVNLTQKVFCLCDFTPKFKYKTEVKILCFNGRKDLEGPELREGEFGFIMKMQLGLQNTKDIQSWKISTGIIKNLWENKE